MTYWPRKWNRCCVPRSDSFHQLIRQSIAYVIALLSLIHYVTLWPWPLTFVSGHACRVTWSTPPPTKFKDPTAIRSWVMSSDISHRITQTMHFQPLRMLHITWPMHRGKFFRHIWNPWPRFAYSLYNLYGTTIKTNGVIRKHSLWHYVKHHIALCACLKSRQPWTLP